MILRLGKYLVWTVLLSYHFTIADLITIYDVNTILIWIIDSAGEYLETINCHDLAVLNNIVKLEAAANAMGQPNGISPTNAQAMVRASKNFVKNMKQILNHAQNYEANMHIAPDYDLHDEAEICMYYLD